MNRPGRVHDGMVEAGGLVLFVVGPLVLLLCWGTAQLGASGAIPRNGSIGIRTRATRSSDEAWTAGHRAARRPALIALIVAAVASTVVFLAHVSSGLAPVVVISYSILLIALVVWLAVVADRAARAVRPSSLDRA